MDLKVHASEDALERLTLGTLPEPEAEKLEEHLLVCEDCRRRLHESDLYISEMRSAAAEYRSAGRQWLPNWRGIWHGFGLPAPALAAALCLVLGLLYFKPWTDGVNQAAVVVAMQALRGGDGLPGAKAPAGRPLSLKLDVSGLPVLDSYVVELVDAHGDVVLKADWRPREGDFAVPGRLDPGQYWVRLEDPPPARTLLREFGLEVR